MTFVNFQHVISRYVQDTVCFASLCQTINAISDKFTILITFLVQVFFCTETQFLWSIICVTRLAEVKFLFRNNARQPPFSFNWYQLCEFLVLRQKQHFHFQSQVDFSTNALNQNLERRTSFLFQRFQQNLQCFKPELW